jgi:hypothetical protein
VSNGPQPLNPDDFDVDENVFWSWLQSTKQLQADHYGVTYPLKGDKLADYVTWNALALVKEVSELTDEFGWKNWAKNRGWVNRENALKEAVDIAHFLANILCAIDVTDEEWTAAYQAKQEVNRQRQRDGYDGVTGKCQVCKRSFDDGIECTPPETVTEVNASGSMCVELEITPAHCAYA